MAVPGFTALCTLRPSTGPVGPSGRGQSSLSGQANAVTAAALYQCIQVCWDCGPFGLFECCGPPACSVPLPSDLRLPVV